MFFRVILLSTEQRARRELEYRISVYINFKVYFSETCGLFLEIMWCKLTVCAVVLLSVGCFADTSEPQVQIYSRNPGEFGKKNVLLCYVSGFHPPDITIELLKDDKEIPGATQTDLAFEQGWKFHLTKYVDFLPKSGEQYSCRVRHMDKTKTYTWEPDM